MSIINLNPKLEVTTNSTILYTFQNKYKDAKEAETNVRYEIQYGVTVDGEFTDGSVRSAVKLISKFSTEPINEDELIIQFSNWIRGGEVKPIENNWSADDDDEETDEEEEEDYNYDDVEEDDDDED
jgi:hypothetical protein